MAGASSLLDFTLHISRDSLAMKSQFIPKTKLSNYTSEAFPVALDSFASLGSRGSDCFAGLKVSFGSRGGA